ncbi:hypothetical protein CDCA_CDCA01G0186 [Cyanidium caldarium]|uniref:DUF2470 domain-containing protein n=1 Tax=Cyanidium caldarium TaxID=2771 RepID=A0AAV9IPZ1_CYACA|nr:hypothetical protein CDCA_CDCA01G0186 [Cyanidium caldarium]
MPRRSCLFVSTATGWANRTREAERGRWADGAWRYGGVRARPVTWGARHASRVTSLRMLREVPAPGGSDAGVSSSSSSSSSSSTSWRDTAVDGGFSSEPAWLSDLFSHGSAHEMIEESPQICRFMNEHHSDHLLMYLRRFGPPERYDNLPELERIEMTQVDRDGFEVDLVLCSDADNNCVCLHERLEWQEGRKCESGEQCIHLLSDLSRQCGLDGDI